jgi:hypothetical protein
MHVSILPGRPTMAFFEWKQALGTASEPIRGHLKLTTDDRERSAQ